MRKLKWITSKPMLYIFFSIQEYFIGRIGLNLGIKIVEICTYTKFQGKTSARNINKKYKVCFSVCVCRRRTVDCGL